MANYIGYDSKIDVEQVDWSAITTDLVKGIKTEDERRVKKKGEIQKASDDLITEISDHQVAIGSDTTYNAYVLDAAEQAKEFALMQNRLMKRGQLKPSAVVRSTQILSDDWKSFEQISKTFQETDAAARQAQSEGLSKLGESSYADFLKEVDINNSRLVVGPEDGRLYFQGKDGKLMNMSSINNRVADLPKDFEIIDSTKKFTDSLGKIIRRDGKGGTIQNIRNEESFINSQKSYIESINADPRNTLSILTQNGYDVTQDPTKVNEKTILIKPDENGLLQPDLSDVNISASNAIMQDRIDAQLDLVFSPENKAGSDDANNEDLLGQQYGYLSNIFNPNEGMRNEARNMLSQNFPNVEDIIVDDEGVTILKNDGTSPALPIKFVRSGKGDTRKYNTAEQMADQLISALTGITSAEKLIRYKAKFKKTKEYQAMKDNFDKALNTESIALLKGKTPRPGAVFDFDAEASASIEEAFELVKYAVDGKGPTLAKALNKYLLRGNMSKRAKNSRIIFKADKNKDGDAITDKGQIILNVGGKDIEIGLIQNLTFSDVISQVKQSIRGAKFNTMSDFNTDPQ